LSSPVGRPDSQSTVEAGTVGNENTGTGVGVVTSGVKTGCPGGVFGGCGETSTPGPCGPRLLTGSSTGSVHEATMSIRPTLLGLYWSVPCNITNVSPGLRGGGALGNARTGLESGCLTAKTSSTSVYGVICQYLPLAASSPNPGPFRMSKLTRSPSPYLTTSLEVQVDASFNTTTSAG